MIDWQAVRDAYVHRFGSIPPVDHLTPDRLEWGWGSENPTAPRRAAGFWMLTFFTPEAPAAPVTYASFGAVCGGAGAEVFLTAVAPYSGFDSAVLELASALPPDVAPLAVVHHPVRLTSFDAMLVLPEEDGSFVLGEEAGQARRALRLVPITPAERRLAGTDPQRLLTLLRAQGALVADPLRACVIAPQADGARRANVTTLLDQHRRATSACAERVQRLLQLGAPEQIVENDARLLEEREALLAHLEARVPAALAGSGAPGLTDEALEEGLAQLYTETVATSVAPYGGLVPPPVAALFVDLLLLLLATHPLIHAITYEAVAGPGQREAATDPGGELTAEIFTETAVIQLSRSATPARARALEDAAEAIVEEARRGSEAGLPGPASAVESWTAIVPKLCLLAANLGVGEGPAVALALDEAAHLASVVDLEPGLDTGPPRTRLARIASAVSKGLYRDYLRARRQPAVAGAPPGSS
jgi:hypothetical protein